MSSKSETYICNDIDSLLSSIAEKNDFSKYVLEVSDAGLKGDGYTSISKNYKLISSNDPSKVLYLFAKIASRNQNLRELISLSDLFNNEIYLYSTVFPTFKQMVIHKGISPLTFFPNCYGSLSNEKNDVLILENLKENGFKLHDCKKTLDSFHISLVITAYAKLHSLSFALRDQKPKMFQSFQSKLLERGCILKSFKGFNQLLRNKYADIKNALSNDHRICLEKFLLNFDNEMNELMEPPIDEYSVIVHGDCWNNNILFKYEANGSDPTEISLVDYQLSRLAPGITDISYFFFTCSSVEEMQRCNDYLDLYYTTLSSHLQSLESDPNKLYPYSKFKEQWKMFAKYALVITPIALQAMLRTTDEVVDLESMADKGLTISESFCYDMKENIEFTSKLSGVVSYLIDNDLL